MSRRGKASGNLSWISEDNEDNHGRGREARRGKGGAGKRGGGRRAGRGAGGRRGRGESGRAIHISRDGGWAGPVAELAAAWRHPGGHSSQRRPGMDPAPAASRPHPALIIITPTSPARSGLPCSCRITCLRPRSHLHLGATALAASKMKRSKAHSQPYFPQHPCTAKALSLERTPSCVPEQEGLGFTGAAVRPVISTRAGSGTATPRERKSIRGEYSQHDDTMMTSDGKDGVADDVFRSMRGRAGTWSSSARWKK